MPHTKPLHQQRSRKALFALLYFCTGVFLIGVVVTVVSIFSIVDSIREDQKTNTSTNRAVLDCTQPEGECAKRGQEATGKAVNDIGRLSIYASACAADVSPKLPVRQRAQMIQSCVTELLEDPPQTPAVP